MAERLISDMTPKCSGSQKGRAFDAFRHIVIQDGSSFAVHDGLCEMFPGRFKAVKPAPIELHTTMDLLCDASTTVVLTPDTARVRGERLQALRCEPEEWENLLPSVTAIDDVIANFSNRGPFRSWHTAILPQGKVECPRMSPFFLPYFTTELPAFAITIGLVTNISPPLNNPFWKGEVPPQSS
jgi:hypothetical protein